MTKEMVKITNILLQCRWLSQGTNLASSLKSMSQLQFWW